MDQPQLPIWTQLLSAGITLGGIILTGVFTNLSNSRNAKAAAAERKQDRDANLLAEEIRIKAEEKRRQDEMAAEEQRWKRQEVAEEKRLHSAERIAREKHVRDLATQLASEAWKRKLQSWEAIVPDERGCRRGPGLSGPLAEPELKQVLRNYFDEVCSILKTKIPPPQ